MADAAKVIRGLEFCLKVACQASSGEKCPYIGSECADGCIYEMQSDALKLLKEQESEAKWIYGEDKTGVDGWYCSECDFFEPWFYEFTDDIDFIRFYGHCPSCGRKMTSYTGKPTQTGG